MPRARADVPITRRGIQPFQAIRSAGARLAVTGGSRRAELCPVSAGFVADAASEEGGFRAAGPTRSQHNRGTGPMSPIASIRVGLVIPLAKSISISVASGTSGSNPPSSTGESANPRSQRVRSLSPIRGRYRGSRAWLVAAVAVRSLVLPGEFGRRYPLPDLRHSGVAANPFERGHRSASCT